MYCEALNNHQVGQPTDYGIKIYKDLDIYNVNETDTRQRWNVMVLESTLYVRGQGVMSSGLYVTHSICPSAETYSDSGFKGYLFSVPFESWKLLDIYDLEALFHSNQFSPYHKMDPLEIKKVSDLMSILYMSLDSANYYEKTEVLTYLCWALMAKLSSCYQNDNLPFQQSDSKHTIANNFVKLVNEYCLKERKLDFYASELGISPKYLSSVVTKATGKNANKWIRECTIKKSKELLLTTSHSIETLATLTKFPTSSGFCKYFRMYSGMTPMRYRKLTLSAKSGQEPGDSFQN